MTWDEIKAIVERVAFPNMAFHVNVIVASPPPNLGGTGYSQNAYAYLQLEGFGRCNDTGLPNRWSSRKWLLSQHMLEGEIVQTCLMAVLAALEHETREQFTYEGVRVFDPHFNIRGVMALRQSEGGTLERTTPAPPRGIRTNDI